MAKRIEKEKAMNILLYFISTTLDKLMYTNDENERERLKEKMNILEQMKEEIYIGNDRIIYKLLKAGKKYEQ